MRVCGGGGGGGGALLFDANLALVHERLDGKLPHGRHVRVKFFKFDLSRSVLVDCLHQKV